jgi:hypothetical protein
LTDFPPTEYSSVTEYYSVTEHYSVNPSSREAST